MKKLFPALVLLALTLVAAVPDGALAQGKYAQTNLDSLTGIRGRTITDGFGAYKYIELRTHGLDPRRLTKKTLWIYMAGKTDSVKVQGGILRTDHAAGLNDTAWVDLQLRDLEKKRTVVPGQVAFHQQIDTLVTWVSDVGIDKGTTRLMAFDDNLQFNVYRVVTGINDTTTIKYRLQGRKDD